jgi:glycine cleavage system transcriptional repressor
MAHYLLTASGRDRPGLVAAVAEALFAAGGNLEDSSMTRLQGEFAMLVIFTAPDATPPAELSTRMNALGVAQRLAIDLKPIDRSEAHPRRSGDAPPSLLVTVHGADRPGIVAGVTAGLAKAGANITDLATHRTTAGDRVGDAGGYILYVEVQPPAGTGPAELEAALAPSARALGVTLRVKTLPSAQL